MALEIFHISNIDRLLERKQPMDIAFTKISTGEKVEAKGVKVTSIHGKEGTCNIEFPSGEKRTIYKILIDRIDNVKIYF